MVLGLLLGASWGNYGLQLYMITPLICIVGIHHQLTKMLPSYIHMIEDPSYLFNKDQVHSPNPTKSYVKGVKAK